MLELPKLEKYDYPETELLKWARFFNATDKEELEMAAEGNEYTQKAYERLVELSADEEKRMEYEARQKALRDYQHMMNSGWRQGYGKGKEAGVELSLIHIFLQYKPGYRQLIPSVRYQSDFSYR